MIHGIGVDQTTISRVAKSIESETFLRRVYSTQERALFESIANKKHASETAAANFAAKEALLKAAGMGIGGLPLAEIEVLREKSGRPYYALTGQAAEWCFKNNLKAHLSITHEGDYATAFAVLECLAAPAEVRQL